jgi:hypothetical protein
MHLAWLERPDQFVEATERALLSNLIAQVTCSLPRVVYVARLDRVQSCDEG